MIRFQILNHAILLTSDALLHFQRFYDTSMQIKTENFHIFTLILLLVTQGEFLMQFMGHF
ncbi:hypothetical protein EFM06_11120 [Lactobacillus helveticus]|nr:hypothetical protein [Lactobacillus helveticus]